MKVMSSNKLDAKWSQYFDKSVHHRGILMGRCGQSDMDSF